MGSGGLGGRVLQDVWQRIRLGDPRVRAPKYSESSTHGFEWDNRKDFQDGVGGVGSRAWV